MSSRVTTFLGWVTLIALLGSLWLLFGEDPSRRQGARGGALYEKGPDLIPKMQKITLKKGNATTTLRLQADRWLITELDDYPADQNSVETFLRSLILSKRREPKTTRQNNFSRLGLGSKALVVGLSGADGDETTLQIGTRSEGGTGRSLTYVFRQGDTRAWLVSEMLELSAYPGDWIDNTVFGIDPQRLARADLEQVVLAKSTGTGVPELVNVATGEQAGPDWQRQSDFKSLSDLSYSDVRAFDEELEAVFSNPVKSVILTTFDGLVITLTVADLALLEKQRPKNIEDISAETETGEQDIWFQLTARYDKAAVSDWSQDAPVNDTADQDSQDNQDRNVLAGGGAEAMRMAESAAGWIFKPSDNLREVLLKEKASYLVQPSDAETDLSSPQKSVQPPSSS